MLSQDYGNDQQVEQTLNSKCKAIKIITTVKSYSLVKFFNNEGKWKIHLIGPLVENCNGVKLGYGELISAIVVNHYGSKMNLTIGFHMGDVGYLWPISQYWIQEFCLSYMVPLAKYKWSLADDNIFRKMQEFHRHFLCYHKSFQSIRNQSAIILNCLREQTPIQSCGSKLS